MELTSTDLADAGRLLGWSARPRERPARHEEYARLVGRYLDDGAFSAACDSVAAGAGLSLHVDRLGGVIAVADSDSALRMPLSELTKRAQNDRRGLVGAILLSIAKVAFPQPAHLDDAERPGRVSVAAVVEYLARVGERLGAEAPDAEADAPDAAALWRAWGQLRRGRSGAQRASFSDQDGAVKKLCRFLEVEGHLQAVSEADGGTWRATPRFRNAVTSLVSDSDIYTALIAVEASDGAARRAGRPGESDAGDAGTYHDAGDEEQR